MHNYTCWHLSFFTPLLLQSLRERSVELLCFMKTWIEAHGNMCIQQLFQKSVNKLGASYELVAGISDFSEPRHEVLYDVCIFSCRGGQRSSVRFFLTFCSLFVRRKWDKSSGILLRTFSGHYECLLLLHSSGRWWALCKYLGPLQLNHLTTDSRKNSSLTLFCFEYNYFEM